jgi:flavin reductase (DIM6/NTAB) family NADH-FMN oxidoreductase RutF
LNDTLGHIDLSVFQQIDIADHVLVIGEVQNLETDDRKKPLIYYRSKYQSLKDE